MEKEPNQSHQGGGVFSSFLSPLLSLGLKRLLMANIYLMERLCMLQPWADMDGDGFIERMSCARAQDVLEV